MYKNINEFIRAYYEKNPEGHYFDQETLSFFGERVSEMRLLKKTVKIKDIRGVEHEAYVISRLQRKHPGGPQRTYAYFNVDALTPIITE
jgi:hypothetical protein